MNRKPVKNLLKILFGKVFADRGYVSQKLALQLLQEHGIEFFAKPRRNMKNKLMRLNDKLMSRKRSIIETIIDQLKNISQIEHSRHRSPINFMVNSRSPMNRPDSISVMIGEISSRIFRYRFDRVTYLSWLSIC